MKRIANFFKSILPVLLMLVLQFVVTLVMGIVYALTTDASMSDVMGGIFGTSSVAGYTSLTNFIYGAAAFIIFGIWYRRAFILPNKGKKKVGCPSGFSFRVILGILLLGIGLYYVTSLVVDVASAIRPQWLANYNSVVQGAGYTDPSLLLILYVVILAPVCEELIFRGLTFRYARNALPFWIANIWQALLFGIMHFVLLQVVYAFVMGLFLGYIVHRGHGVRYSIPVHIVFNIIGLFFYELVGRTLELHYALAMICGLAVTVLALWLFSSYFKPSNQNK